MRKKLSVCIVALVGAFCAFAQSNSSVDISNEIYDVLENAQLRGLCGFLPGAKPWPEKRILAAIDEVLLNRARLHPAEVKVLEDFAASRERKPAKEARSLHFRVQNRSARFPMSFDFRFGLEASASGGLYTRPEFDQWGFDIIPSFHFAGDVGKNVSYRLAAFFDITRMPLYECGDDYFIGYAWYADGVEDFLDGRKDADGLEYAEPRRRTVRKLLNTSYLPYQYQKRWDGQMYLLSNLSASGLEGWPQTAGLSGGINPEIRASFLDGRISVGAGRIYREWAAMDSGSSLVLNGMARPFFSGDVTVELFPFLKFSSLAGILEYPNQDYMNEDSYPEEKDGIDDSYFYQNAFSVNMLELDFTYLHFDFGSSVVYPKRFEVGYLFPLVTYVEYQNHIGDCDNLALFGNIKVRKPGLGSIWASLYLDEINGLNNNPFTSSRAMFAGQLGTKVVFPWLPFGSVSMRYTKVEPYCYTHHSINYTPWYAHYISENYTNNGELLGYYLPPNSDEFLFRFEARPAAGLTASVQYQFVRHGADYGSQQVPGSSLYSELSPYNRDDLEKYFLHDGAYQWMHIASASVLYNFQKTKVPFQLSATAGFMYSYYTMIDDDVYAARFGYGNNGNSGADRYTPFHFVDSGEYPVQAGAVLSVGMKLWFW